MPVDFIFYICEYFVFEPFVAFVIIGLITFNLVA